MVTFPGVLNCLDSFQIFTNKTMKKLNLEKLKLSSEEVIQREQMTQIYGGSGSGSGCFLRCDNWERSMAVDNCSSSSSWLFCGDQYSTCNCN